MLIHLGTPEDGERVIEPRWPEARAVSDENGQLYDAFGLGRGSLGQLLGPRVLLAGLRSVKHGFGLPVGDARRMSGWFLIKDGAVVWSHKHEHSGAPRRYAELIEAHRGDAHL